MEFNLEQKESGVMIKSKVFPKRRVGKSEANIVKLFSNNKVLKVEALESWLSLTWILKSPAITHGKRMELRATSKLRNSETNKGKDILVTNR